jgi:hypothetical protein
VDSCLLWWSVDTLDLYSQYWLRKLAFRLQTTTVCMSCLIHGHVVITMRNFAFQPHATGDGCSPTRVFKAVVHDSG